MLPRLRIKFCHLLRELQSFRMILGELQSFRMVIFVICLRSFCHLKWSRLNSTAVKHTYSRAARAYSKHTHTHTDSPRCLVRVVFVRLKTLLFFWYPQISLCQRIRLFGSSNFDQIASNDTVCQYLVYKIHSSSAFLSPLILCKGFIKRIRKPRVNILYSFIWLSRISRFTCIYQILFSLKINKIKLRMSSATNLLSTLRVNLTVECTVNPLYTDTRYHDKSRYSHNFGWGPIDPKTGFVVLTV